jgi:hypothetical protein
MNVLMFIVQNWDNILTLVVLVVSIILGMQKWIRVNGPIFKEMTTEEKIAYVTRLLKNLVPIALVLVTNAEIQFGGGTGTLKRSAVIDELYKRIPDEYKKYVTEDNLDAIITQALEQAEKIWADNPKVKAIVYQKDKFVPLMYNHNPGEVLGKAKVEDIDGGIKVTVEKDGLQV